MSPTFPRPASPPRRRHLPFAARLAVAVLATHAAGSAQAADLGTFRSFGEQPGLLALSTDFVERLAADPRIAEFFAKTHREQLARQLADQFCQGLDGPCRYSGADMKTAHDAMGVRKADFFALVEDLQAAMAARGIPFAAQNQLLARLAPMHRDIVEARP